jgi:glutamate synthase (NADPH/NADH) small chain
MHYHTPEKLQEQARQLIAEYVSQIDSLKPKDRTKIPPQEMPAQNPLERIHNLDEVAIGYTFEQARVEALRCLQCVKKNCVEDCPVKIDIPRFINHIAHGDLEQAA